MKAMVLERQQRGSSRPLAARDIADPVPGHSEILVRVAACGVCRTDLHVVEGDLPARKLPLIPGHQVVGRVAATGEGTSRFREGDRVGIAWLRATCGRCAFCRDGRENLCAGSRYTGWDDDGGYADYAVVDERYAYVIPDPLSDTEAAPLLCAGIIGYRALRRSGVKPGQKLGLYGFGSSAHIVAQIARARGCEIYVATRDQAHRDLASELGATWTADAHAIPPVALDAAIVFAPAGTIVPAALRALGKGGTVVLAGIHMSDVPSMSYDDCLFHEKSLTSVESNTRTDGEELLSEAARLGLRPRVTSFGLDDANEALTALSRDALRGSAVLVP